jgi:hypothetical protein
MTAALRVNFAPKYRLETWRLSPSPENLAIEYLRKLGAENVHRRKQRSRKNIFAGFLQHSVNNEDAFLFRIITGDES